MIELTADQEKELNSVSDEGKEGHLVSQSKLDQKVEKWLSERSSEQKLLKKYVLSCPFKNMKWRILKVR